MRFLLLRFDAPLLSFGGTVVDARGVTDTFPARSMIAGLAGNALGYDHRDVDALARLQARLVMGARRDREGERVVDYQTVDLGQPFLAHPGWTTDGRVEERGKGEATSGTHIRNRHFLADAIYTVAVRLADERETPTLDDLRRALDEPARPLFLGRKCCLPSTPIALDIVEAASMLDALTDAPVPTASFERRRSRVPMRALVRVPRSEAREGFVERAVTEVRDWANQVHVGRSFVCEGFVNVGVGAS